MGSAQRAPFAPPDTSNPWSCTCPLGVGAVPRSNKTPDTGDIARSLLKCSTRANHSYFLTDFGESQKSYQSPEALLPIPPAFHLLQMMLQVKFRIWVLQTSVHSAPSQATLNQGPGVSPSD